MRVFTLLTIMLFVLPWSCKSSDSRSDGSSQSSQSGERRLVQAGDRQRSARFSVRVTGADDRTFDQSSGDLRVLYDMGTDSPSLYFRRHFRERRDTTLFQISVYTGPLEAGEYELSEELPSAVYSILHQREGEGMLDGTDSFHRDIVGTMKISSARGDVIDGTLNFSAQNSERDKVEITVEFSGVSLKR